MTKFLIPGLVFFALAGVLYIGVVHSPNKSTMQSALLGKPAPSFDLPTLADPAVRITSSRLAGQPWVLNVWGTWCQGCREEHEALMNISRERAVALIGFNWKDDDELAKEWLAQLGNPYDVVAVDKDGRASIEYGVYGAPETFLIDEHGIVQYRHVGPMTLEVWRREFLSRLPQKALP